MIVSCGRQECIAIRSRESRTLYISEPVTTHTATSPSHAKLLVSTFIHSYNDACARVREMERCLNPIHNPAAQVEAQRHYADWLPLYNLHIDKENKPATKAPKPKAKKLVLHEESQESRDKVCASLPKTMSSLSISKQTNLKFVIENFRKIEGKQYNFSPTSRDYTVSQFGQTKRMELDAYRALNIHRRTIWRLKQFLISGCRR